MPSAKLFEVEENRPSAVLVVIDKIKELLIDRRLQPGEMIPSESVLAENLRVGRGSVREALKILSAFGVIEIRRGTGTFISSASNRRLFDPALFQILVQERDYKVLTQVRELLEVGIVKLVIQSATPEDLAELDEAALLFLAELTVLNASESTAKNYDIQYHRLLGKFAHNAIIENIYAFVIELFTSTINPIHQGVFEVHRDLHRAIMEHDEDAAIEAVIRHTAIWIESYRESVALRDDPQDSPRDF